MQKNWFGNLSSSSRQPQSSDEITRMQIEDEEEGGKMDRILDVCRCVICFNPWKREGDNQICCLNRCGHLFCSSCISKLIAKCSTTGDSAKCPTCRTEFEHSDVRSDVTMIYGCPVVVIDEELRRRNRTLEEENVLLQSKRGFCGSGPIEAVYLCNPTTSTYGNPSQFIFLDSIHPTQSAYQFLSQYLEIEILPKLLLHQSC